LNNERDLLRGAALQKLLTQVVTERIYEARCESECCLYAVQRDARFGHIGPHTAHESNNVINHFVKHDVAAARILLELALKVSAAMLILYTNGVCPSSRLIIHSTLDASMVLAIAFI
jgi:hypothetical protein